MEEVEGVDLKAFKESQYQSSGRYTQKTSGHEGNLSDHGNAEILFRDYYVFVRSCRYQSMQEKLPMASFAS